MFLADSFSRRDHPGRRGRCRAVPALAAALALQAGTAAAAPRVFEIEGLITAAEFLTFAVLNGELIGANPPAADLPLPYTARLSYDDMAASASFEFGGRVDAPGRSYAFDAEISGLFSATTLTDSSIVVDANLGGIDFELSASLDGAGSSSWRWVEAGAVPLLPAEDRFAEADISAINEVPLPAAALFMLSGLLALGAVARRRPGATR